MKMKMRSITNVKCKQAFLLYLPRLLGQFGRDTQRVIVVIVGLVRRVPPFVGSTSFAFLDARLETADGTGFFPLQIRHDELETTLGHGFRIPWFPVNVRRP